MPATDAPQAKPAAAPRVVPVMPDDVPRLMSAAAAGDEGAARLLGDLAADLCDRQQRVDGFADEAHVDAGRQRGPCVRKYAPPAEPGAGDLAAEAAGDFTVGQVRAAGHRRLGYLVLEPEALGVYTFAHVHPGFRIDVPPQAPQGP